MSTLSNVSHQLAWSEFTDRRKDPMPPPGTLGAAAYTKPLIRTSGFGLEGIPNTKPPKGRVKDTIMVSVELDPASWVEEWVFTLAQPKQDALLNHEQGHFVIGALLARDFYYDLLALRKKQYSSPAEANADFDKLKDARNKALIAITDKYDAVTRHGDKPAEQATWDAYFQTAFTALRVPAESAADGSTLKKRLPDVLKDAGVAV